MMGRNRQTQEIAFTTTLIYLCMTAYMIFGVEGHALRHGKVSHHAAQHRTILCSWMCAASTHVYAADQKFQKVSIHFIETLVSYTEKMFSHPHLLAYFIRPPPFTLI
ncbi:MAG: hypothetical protein ACE5GK_06805 [Nitrospiria bacterium]